MTTIQQQLAARDSATRAAATTRYWQLVVEEADGAGTADLDEAERILRILNLTPANLRNDVEELLWLRATSVDESDVARAAAALDEAKKRHADLRERLAKLQAEIAEVEPACSAAGWAESGAAEDLRKWQRHRAESLERLRAVEATFRARGFSGELPLLPPRPVRPAPALMRVRAIASHTDDNGVAREPGDVFEIKVDRYGALQDVVQDVSLPVRDGRGRAVDPDRWAAAMKRAPDRRGVPGPRAAEQDAEVSPTEPETANDELEETHDDATDE